MNDFLSYFCLYTDLPCLYHSLQTDRQLHHQIAGRCSPFLHGFWPNLEAALSTGYREPEIQAQFYFRSEKCKLSGIALEHHTLAEQKGFIFAVAYRNLLS